MKPNPKRTPERFGAALLAGALLLSGCKATNHHVIATTATVIGVEIGQAPANTTAQAKLGYNRSEFALVPTNRRVTEQGVVSGAQESADVLMELRYGSIFSLSNGGIYQRLAVGRNAVGQAGAAFMFAKDAGGNLEAAEAQAVSEAVQAIPVSDAARLLEKSPLDGAHGALKTNTAKKDAFDRAAVSAGFADYAAFTGSKPSSEQIRKVRAALEADAEIKAELAKQPQR